MGSLPFWVALRETLKTLNVVNKKLNLYIFIILFCGLIPTFLNSQSVSQNSPDVKAIKIANDVIYAMGGIESFNEIQYIGWTFFDVRKLIWDKKNDLVRIDYIKKQLTIITSLHSEETKLYMNGIEINHPDSLSKYSIKGKKIWANDSYWLIMPFKLLDDGVNLKYVQDSMFNNANATILEMTFENVGFTPENKYWIYVDLNTNLVTQWSFFDKYSDTQAEFSNTWGDYKLYGNILISGDRGVEGKLDDIQVWDELQEDVFEKL